MTYSYVSFYFRRCDDSLIADGLRRPQQRTRCGSKPRARRRFIALRVALSVVTALTISVSVLPLTDTSTIKVFTIPPNDRDSSMVPVFEPVAYCSTGTTSKANAEGCKENQAVGADTSKNTMPPRSSHKQSRNPGPWSPSLKVGGGREQGSPNEFVK
jgi:hypothetical protein